MPHENLPDTHYVIDGDIWAFDDLIAENSTSITNWRNIYRRCSDNGIYLGSMTHRTHAAARSAANATEGVSEYVCTAYYFGSVDGESTEPDGDNIVRQDARPQHVLTDYNRVRLGIRSHNGIVARTMVCYRKVVLEIEHLSPDQRQSLIELRDTANEFSYQFSGDSWNGRMISSYMQRNRRRSDMVVICWSNLVSDESEAWARVDPILTSLGFRARSTTVRRSASARPPMPDWVRTRSYGCTSPEYLICDEQNAVDRFDDEQGGIGIEIEVGTAMSPARRLRFSNAICSDQRAHCEFKSDGSLARGGVEICPQPFASLAGMVEHMKRAYPFLPDAVKAENHADRSNRDIYCAGTHIHISGTDLELPTDWWSLKSKVIDFVKLHEKLFEKLSNARESNWSSYKSPRISRGWWNPKGDAWVEFRGFGPVRTPHDIGNYVAIIKATLWACYAKAPLSHSSRFKLFVRKLARFGYVNVDAYPLISSCPEPAVTKPPHISHGLVLGREVAEQRRIARMTHTCELPIHMTDPFARFNDYVDKIASNLVRIAQLPAGTDIDRVANMICDMEGDFKRITNNSSFINFRRIKIIDTIRMDYNRFSEAASNFAKDMLHQMPTVISQHPCCRAYIREIGNCFHDITYNTIGRALDSIEGKELFSIISQRIGQIIVSQSNNNNNNAA